MPEWTKEIVLALIVAITGGVGWLFKSWREDRKAKHDTASAEKRSLEERAERLQGKVESLLMDAIARERESNAQMVDRIAMDKQQNEVIAAATAALNAMARRKDGP